MIDGAGTPSVVTLAWKPKPSYGIVATQDRMINPDLERTMYGRTNAKVAEMKDSYAAFISRTRAVANVVVQATREIR